VSHLLVKAINSPPVDVGLERDIVIDEQGDLVKDEISRKDVRSHQNSTVIVFLEHPPCPTVGLYSFPCLEQAVTKAKGIRFNLLVDKLSLLTTASENNHL
jgi:hypothetical protein